MTGVIKNYMQNDIEHAIKKKELLLPIKIFYSECDSTQKYDLRRTLHMFAEELLLTDYLEVEND